MSRIKPRERCGNGIYRPRNLGVNEQYRTKPGDLRHRDPQIRFAHMRKFVDARMDQKAFETANAALDQRCKLGRISRHDAAPECHIHRAFPVGGSELFLKSGKRRGRRECC